MGRAISREVFTDSVYADNSPRGFETLESWDLVGRWTDPAFRHFFRRVPLNAKFLSGEEGVKERSTILCRLMAMILLVFCIPVFIVVSVGILFTMPGCIFYKQVRVGKNGKLFSVLKFRSMIQNAESSTGHTLSWEGDPRITRFGRFLRNTHIDELPQLINVLQGDMRFIGPRPERPEFTKLYDNKDWGYSRRSAVKPGITGLAQLACPYNASALEKLGYDLMYVASAGSFMLDALITFYTIKKIVFMKKTAGITK